MITSSLLPEQPLDRGVVGRFAPSPSGRMHLGNIAAAWLSWKSVRERGGKWILRIEDIDRGRSRLEWAKWIEDDLAWLGLDWDEGGLEGKGEYGPYVQSERNALYEAALAKLSESGLTYPCSCTRGEVLAARAPHASDGNVVYSGRCRPEPGKIIIPREGRQPATRIIVPDRDISFVDRISGLHTYNLAHDCGDFIVRRSDGGWAYQLAVVVDDALMGVSEVVRGEDLLESTACQLYLYELLGWRAPEFAHIPLMRNEDGERLSKRDRSLSMEELRRTCTPAEVLEKISKANDLNF